jgi:hypothetical protein
MSQSNQRFGVAKFASRQGQNFDRRANTREERQVKEDLPKITFSFKDFDIRQIPPGQTYSTWEEEKMLSAFCKKMEEISKMNIVEAQQQGVLKIYGAFPDKSEFKHPSYIVEGVNWAVIMDVKGQKGRVAGHIIANVFYVVFLDKDHKFYITKKRNT